MTDPAATWSTARSRCPQPLQVARHVKSPGPAPVSNDAVTVTFKQAIGANDALRTGTYAKTLTFTLSTTIALMDHAPADDGEPDRVSGSSAAGASTGSALGR